MCGSRKKTHSHSTTPAKRQRRSTKSSTGQFKFKKRQPGGSVPYPNEEAPAFNLESVPLALSQGWDTNTSWTEDELVFPPPGSGCVPPPSIDPWSHFNTPLHRALFQRQFDVAQLLLDHGADIDQLNASGRTVLHEAIDQGINTFNKGWTKRAAWIVEHGANLDKKTEERTVVVAKESYRGKPHEYNRSGGISPLRMATILGDVAKVQRLAAAGANVNLPLDEDGCWFPLDVAFLRRQLDLVEVFEHAGASLSTEMENSTSGTDDISKSDTGGQYLEESRNLLLFCLFTKGLLLYPTEHGNSIPPPSCQAVFRSIVDTDEFRTAWRQKCSSNGPTRYQASMSTFFRMLSEKAQTRNPLEIPESYCALCKDVITRLNLSQSSKLRHAPTLQELESTSRDGCPFCGLLLDTVDNSTSRKGNKGDASSDNDSEDDAIMLRVYNRYNRISHLEEEFLDYSPGRNERQTGGTGSSRALSLCKIWLRRCRESHIDCRRLHDSTDPILPTRVLDVTGGTLDDPKVKLIETSRMKRGTYCALSYCWGKSRCVTTTKANLVNHKHDIPVATLPRTIRDAVLATRGLEINYLWVDSLCIVQDDTDDWSSEAAIMGDVYANATLTISTLSGTDCDDGLFTPHSFRQPYVLPFPIPPTPDRASNTRWVVPAVQPPVKENNAGMLELPFRGPIHSRGWTFQEQMLSTRILWFGQGHVQWECLSKFAVDSSPDSMGHYEYPSYKSGEPRRTRRMKGHLQRSFKIKATLSQSEQQDNAIGRGTSSEEDDPVDAYTEWETLVAEYTTRSLTKESDRIPAILGLANVMGPMFECDFLMGIWKGKHFLRSLLWQVQTASTCTALQSSNSYPSWTWASKSGCAINYSMARQGGGRASSWPTSLVAIDETHVWNGITGSITLKGPLGKLTPRQIEVLGSKPSFDFTTEMSMDLDPKGSIPQGLSVWYIDVVNFEHGAAYQGYGKPVWPQGQAASVVKLLLEAADCEEPPRLFRRIGIVHMRSGEQDAMVREVTIV
ncbi:het-domain-containing protein [Fusarium sporotrichioides]|uniref:Het-domain-containing protein n=1 Tax=Fusarium sporotrichioides TaxID=5514 RepID=A0A395RRA2_FUSSP|nr:het-domain-containing protein [Fusarium sporotrichioides]